MVLTVYCRGRVLKEFLNSNHKIKLRKTKLRLHGREDVDSRLGDNGEVVIAVIGLGYVGLPTAIAFHNAGFKVLGVDINQESIKSISAGKAPISDSTTDFDIPEISESWKLSSKFEGFLLDADIILVTVPTPVNEDNSPDLRIVRSAMKSVLSNIEHNQRVTVVLESTVYPGATMEIVDSIKKDLGEEFPANIEVGYSPERVSPGDIGRGAKDVAKIVGANDETVGKMLASIYSKITNAGCKFVGPIEVAEAAKMVENVQRDIDIAFANELAIILPEIGVDVEKVLEAASTKWNFHRHSPGIGVGGHCIPVDPYYYISISEKVGKNPLISKSARSVNRNMPRIASEQIIEELNGVRDPRVLILGFSYKPEIGDCRETPVLPLIENLLYSGVRVSIFDPYVDAEEIPDSVSWAEHLLEEENDLIVLATAHQQLLNLDWKMMLEKCSTDTIYDGRRKLDKEKMEKIGWRYRGIGVP